MVGVDDCIWGEKMMKGKYDKCYIIAEIGGNFSDYDTAKILIDQAAECGVDAVKLQTYRAETISSKEAVFEMENLSGISQIEYFKKYEIDEETHRKIYEYAQSRSLDIFSTPSHVTDVELLERMGTDVYKIGADDATNIPFLKQIAKLKKPIMLSTGMCTLEEIRMAVNAILEEGNSDIVIMHVVSLYPTPSDCVNLNAIETLKREFPQFTIGYSDHTLGVDSCIFAAVKGANVIEKHFTYDKAADGPDHILSATKDEMSRLVEAIRLFEKMQGNGVKMPIKDEVKNRRNNRKSVVYTVDLNKGDIITAESVDIKRPGWGIQPKDIETLIGKTLKRDVKRDTLATWGDF